MLESSTKNKTGGRATKRQANKQSAYSATRQNQS